MLFDTIFALHDLMLILLKYYLTSLNSSNKVETALFQEIANEKVGCDAKKISKFFNLYKYSYFFKNGGYDFLRGLFTKREILAPRRWYLEGRISLISGDNQQKSRRQWKKSFEVSYFALLLLLVKR